MDPINPFDPYRREEFKKLQPQLLKIANSPGGRFILSTLGPKIPNWRIIRITPNAIHFDTGERVKTLKGRELVYWSIHFSGKDVVYILLQPILDKIRLANQYKPINKLEEAFLHYSGLETKFNRYPTIYLTTTSFNAGAGDGCCYNQNNGYTWAQARGNASSDTANYTSSTINSGGGVAFSSPNYYCGRIYYPTDTSSIGASATITAAVLNAYTTLVGGGSTFDDWACDLIQTSQASTSSLATSDFSAITYTSGVRSNPGDNSYGTWTFNATGLTWVSKTGFTKVGLVHKFDFDNTTPTINTSITPTFSESASNKPYIDVTYTAASSLHGLSLMGVGL